MRKNHSLPSPCALLLLSTSVFAAGALTACGDDGGAPAVAASGGSAAAGAAGAAAGNTNAGGKAGASGNPTVAGSGGTAGAAGTSAGKSGSGGTAGTASSGGGAGSGAGGAAGCTKDDECPKVLSTIPANCATGKCDAGKCVFVAVDGDGDGHRTSKCKPNDASAIVSIGDDCDDADPTTSPSGWDGPAGEGKPNHCGDGIDQNCSGAEDDQKLADGTTCTCTPGDKRSCSEDDLGKKVNFPNLVGGIPIAPCAFGGQTCLASGKWGPCTGLKAPEPETCDEQDNDCNGVKDDDASDAQLWVWDADNDQHAAGDCVAARSCKNVPPKDRPVGCKSSDCKDGDCANAAWKLAASVVADDCDDTNAKRRPGLPEICDELDNDCNEQVDDGSGAKKGWLFDGDGDGYVGATSPKRFDCAPPTVCPDGISSCDVARWTADTTAKLDCNDDDGSINPTATESCGDAIDKNCNGSNDDECGPCVPGASVECYTGNAGNAFGAPSICKKGTAICGSDGKPGECQGQILPGSELCNGLDDNCDGQVDEGFGVNAGAASYCNVAEKTTGACLLGGIRKCSNNVSVCEPLDADIGQQKYRSVRSPKADGSTGSFDWNCTGGSEKQWVKDVDYTTECDLAGLFKACSGKSEVLCSAAFDVAKRRRFCGTDQASPNCGSQGIEIRCAWNTNLQKCEYNQEIPIFQGCR